MSDLKIKLRSAATLEFAGANGKTVVVDVESGVQSVDSQAEANKATFAKCTTAWLTNDLETLKSTMASDCTVTFNGPTGAGPLVNRTWYGHDGLMQYLTEIYCESRFTKFEHREITADGQYIYATSCMDYVTRSTGKCAKGVNMNFKIEFNDDGLMKKWVFTFEDSDVAINQYKLHGVSRTVMTIKSGQMDEFVKRYETLIPQIKQFPGFVGHNWAMLKDNQILSLFYYESAEHRDASKEIRSQTLAGMKDLMAGPPESSFGEGAFTSYKSFVGRGACNVTTFKMKPGSVENMMKTPIFAKVNDETASWDGYVSSGNIRLDDFEDSYQSISFYESKEHIEKSAEKRKAAWANFADHFAEAPDTQTVDGYTVSGQNGLFIYGEANFVDSKAADLWISVNESGANDNGDFTQITFRVAPTTVRFVNVTTSTKWLRWNANAGARMAYDPQWGPMFQGVSSMNCYYSGTVHPDVKTACEQWNQMPQMNVVYVPSVSPYFAQVFSNFTSKDVVANLNLFKAKDGCGVNLEKLWNDGDMMKQFRHELSGKEGSTFCLKTSEDNYVWFDIRTMACAKKGMAKQAELKESMGKFIMNMESMEIAYMGDTDASFEAAMGKWGQMPGFSVSKPSLAKGSRVLY